MTKVTWDEFCEELKNSEVVRVNYDVLLKPPTVQDDIICFFREGVIVDYEVEIRKRDNEFVNVICRSTYEFIGEENVFGQRQVIVELFDLK